MSLGLSISTGIVFQVAQSCLLDVKNDVERVFIVLVNTRVFVRLDNLKRTCSYDSTLSGGDG